MKLFQFRSEFTFTKFHGHKQNVEVFVPEKPKADFAKQNT